MEAVGIMSITVNCKELKAFGDNIKKILYSDREEFMKDCARELAARLLQKVIKRPPVVTGNLRRGWTGGQKKGGLSYAKALPINKSGDTYTIQIFNPVDYASYVEYGHRTPGGNGWVDGQFMLTIAEKELEGIMPAVLEKKLAIWLKEVFNN